MFLVVTSDYFPETSPSKTNGATKSGSKRPLSVPDKLRSHAFQKVDLKSSKRFSKQAYHGHATVHISDEGTHRVQTPTKSGEGSSSSSEPSPPSTAMSDKQENDSSHKGFATKKDSGKDGQGVTRLSSCTEDIQSQQDCWPCGGTNLPTSRSKSKVTSSHFSSTYCFALDGYISDDRLLLMDFVQLAGE